MGPTLTHKKEPPWLCLRWPSKEASTSGGCTLEAPLPVKALRNIGQFLIQSISRLQNIPATRPLLVDSQKRVETGNTPLSPQEQGQAEQRALALALSLKKPATVLEFYSPKCTLCRSLLPTILEVESRNAAWLNIVLADVENKLWLPEVLLYDINYVPCFVLLDSTGTALSKTGTPFSRLHVLTGLSYLLESLRPTLNGVADANVTNS
ncbi:hypothetical protein L7F22_029983 [Adiantum nelumboides]|nr:hypothetical protein [Adiantum nelumboides]